MPPPSIWASQPFKALYITCFIIKTPIELVFLTILYLICGRPLPARTLGQNVAATLTRKVFHLCATARLPLLVYDDPALAGDRCVVVSRAADDECYAGTISSFQSVKPQAQPVVWFPGPPPATAEESAKLKTERIVLHFIGGAFCMGLGYKHYGDDLWRMCSQHLKADRVIWSDYRICDGSPELQFPAPIQDAVTHYAYLISLGVNPKNIILSGDSAGGNVVITLIRHLELLQKQPNPSLPLPGGAIVYSPFVNVIPTIGTDFYKYENSQWDTVSSSLGQWGVDCYRPAGKLSEEVEGFISPLDNPFQTSVPIYIHDGDAEVLHENIKIFAGQMVKENGEKIIRYHSTPTAPHDLLLAHPVYKMTAELGKIIEEASDFFQGKK